MSDHISVTEPTSFPIARPEGRLLTAEQFQALAVVPPESEWFANIRNPRTRRAYRMDIGQFKAFLGISSSDDFRTVTRAHVIAWRGELASRVIQDGDGRVLRVGLSPATIRRKLSAVSALFDDLCERNAVAQNPVHGVQRPEVENANEGKTPAISDDQARLLLAAPPADTLKGMRDRAILAVFLYHGLRREELCTLTVGAMQPRRGILHFRVKGKGRQSAVRSRASSGSHADRRVSGIEQPLRRNRRCAFQTGAKPLHRRVGQAHAPRIRVPRCGEAPRPRRRHRLPGFCDHALRATAATEFDALEHEADIARGSGSATPSARRASTIAVALSRRIRRPAQRAHQCFA